MSDKKWQFSLPDESDPGESVHAIVVYTETGSVGVRAMDRGEVRDKWGIHAFAWMPMEYPTYTIDDLSKVQELYRKTPKEN